MAMLWWHVLFCIITIHRIIHFVQSQDEDEESTTIPLSTITDDAESAERVSLIIPSRTINNLMNNGSEQNVRQVIPNDSSKQRIIITLAVLCAALTVLLGFLVSIVVCQWWQHERDQDDLENETTKARPDLVGPSYNYHDQAYRQAIKL